MSTDKKKVEKLPLSEKEAEFNREVTENLLDPLNAIAATLKDSFKPRVFDGINHKTVYGPNAANKSQVGKLISLIEKFAESSKKYLIEQEVDKSDQGYAAIVYMSREIAPMVGIVEGTDLWPAGSNPILSPGLLSAWSSIYFFLNDLKHDEPGRRKLFRCDDYMRQYIGKFHGAVPGDDSKKNTPFNLDAIDFPRLQQIFKYFIIRGPDGKAAPLGLPADSPRLKAYDQMMQFYDQLKAQKEDIKKKRKTRVEKAQEDLVKAQQDVAEGAVPERFAVKAQEMLVQAQQEYAQAVQNFIDSAASMGIHRNNVVA